MCVLFFSQFLWIWTLLMYSHNLRCGRCTPHGNFFSHVLGGRCLKSLVCKVYLRWGGSLCIYLFWSSRNVAGRCKIACKLCLCQMAILNDREPVPIWIRLLPGLLFKGAGSRAVHLDPFFHFLANQWPGASVKDGIHWPAHWQQCQQGKLPFNSFVYFYTPINAELPSMEGTVAHLGFPAPRSFILSLSLTLLGASRVFRHVKEDPQQSSGSQPPCPHKPC